MGKGKVEDIVFDIAQPIAENNDLELVDVEFVKEGQNWYLRAYIDKELGVTLDDCQRVSEELSSILDEKDPISIGYFLEVSSPGLDRPLKKERDFLKYIGREIEVTLYQPYNNSKYFKGINKGIDEQNLKLLLDGNEEIVLSVKSIASARLYFEL